MLCLVLKIACNWTEAGSNIDPPELEGAQQKLFLLVQKESFSLERKSLLKSSPICKTSTILKLSPFIGPKGLLRERTCPSTGNCYIRNKTSCDT